MSIGGKTSGCIVFQKPGTRVPKEYLEKALKAFPTFCSFMYMKDNKIAIDSYEDADIHDLEAVLDIMQETNRGCFLHMGYNPNGQMVDVDVQPFSLLSDQKGVTLATMLAGDFPQFYEEGSKSSTAYLVATTFLTKWFDDLLELSGDDLSKTLERLSEDHNKRIIHDLFQGGDGTVVFLTATGKSKIFARGSEHREHEWGWTTSHQNFTKAAPSAPAPATAPKNVLSEVVNRAKATTPKPVVDPLQASLGDAPAAKVSNTAITEAAESVATTGYDPATGLVYMPADMVKRIKEGKISNTKIKDWYRATAGYVPKDEIWKSGLPCLHKDQISKKAEERPAQSTAPAPAPTKVESTVVHGSNKVTMADQGKIRKLFLDHGSKKILSPEEIIALDSKVPSFAKLLGLNGIEDTFDYSYEAFVELGKMGRHDLLARLICDYRMDLLKLLQGDTKESEGEDATNVIAKEKKEEEERLAAEQSSPDKPVVAPRAAAPKPPRVLPDVSKKEKKGDSFLDDMAA
jgi:hypothetical protein